MTVYLNNKSVVGWVISQTGPQPAWVKEAFTKNYLRWSDGHLVILMSALRHSVKADLTQELLGLLAGSFCGYQMYQLGREGDFLDLTHAKVVSAKKFAQKYQQKEAPL